jgi:hypothetical protein
MKENENTAHHFVSNEHCQSALYLQTMSSKIIRTGTYNWKKRHRSILIFWRYSIEKCVRSDKNQIAPIYAL